MKKVYLFSRLIIIVIALILFSPLWHKWNRTYCLNYFGPIGFKPNISYEGLIAKKGIPLEIIEDEDYYLIYDEFTYVAGSKKNFVFKRLEITGKGIRFGKNKLGIGSTREEVENAYKRTTRITDTEKDVFGVIDGLRSSSLENPWIEYHFTEDYVTKIKIYFGP